MSRHRSSATPLAIAYAVLIVYASLYPFTGWRPVATNSPLEWLILPWPRYWGVFDVWSNLLGYLPFGLLAYGAAVRSGVRQRWAFVLTLAVGALLSLSMEELQNFLPHRVPSRKDWLMNSAGTLLGLVIAAGVHRLGWVDRWQAVRDRWFIQRSAGAIALLLLWPLGLLFPPPVPFGLGQMLVRLPEWTAEIFEGTVAAPWFERWADAVADNSMQPLSTGAEALTTVLGLLAPCLVAYSVSRTGWRRLVLMAGAAASGFAATTLSTALNFGPDHLLAWLTDAALPALALGLLAAALLVWLPPRAAAGLGLMVLTGLVALVAQAPADPYYADSLQSWEQGRFIRFHGVAQWVGWLWPYATMLYLLVRIGSRDEA